MVRKNNLFGAVSIMVGTAVGAGIFGLPYVMAQAGFLVGLGYLIVLTILTAFITLAYGEVILRTPGTHQFTGYAEKYLGKKGKIFGFLTLVFGMYGSLIAYLIEVPNFLHALLGETLGGGLLVYRIVFFIFVALAIFIGLGLIVRLEKFMIVVLMLIVLVFLIFGLSKVNVSNYFSFNMGQLFLPYGVVLFALGSLSATPDMKNLLTHQKGQLKKAIIIGMTLVAIVYFLFSLLVVGVTGAETTESAVLGLSNSLGEVIVDLGAIFGALSMTTSFLVIGLVLQEVYQYDFKINKILSWFLVLSIPLIVVFLDFLSFIQVLGIVGGLIGGLQGVLLLVIYFKAKKKGKRKPEYSLKTPKILWYIVGLVYILGMVYQLYDFIRL